MFHYVITWCRGRDQRQRETHTPRTGYESNGQRIVSENDLLVNIEGDTVSLRRKQPRLRGEVEAALVNEGDKKNLV